VVESASMPAARRWSSTDLLMLSVVLIWGINFPVVKVSLRSLSPMAFNSLRFILATGVMIAITRMRGESLRLDRRDILGVLVLGLAGHTAYQWLFIHGIALTSSANTSLLMATSPIFVALYSHLLGVERGNRIVWAGILLSFAGVGFLIAGGPNGLSLAGGATLGDLLVLLSATLWASYTVLSRPLLRHYSPIKLTTVAMMAGIPPLVLLSVPELLHQDWSAVPPAHWMGVIYSGLLSLAVAYTFWGTSVQRVGNARTAVYSNVVPIVTIAASWIILGDRLTLLQGIGAAVVLGGLLLTRQGRSIAAQRS
jgi:drug/metabolite transporter (DMT)-like permease